MNKISKVPAALVGLCFLLIAGTAHTEEGQASSRFTTDKGGDVRTKQDLLADVASTNPIFAGANKAGLTSLKDVAGSATIPINKAALVESTRSKAIDYNMALRLLAVEQGLQAATASMDAGVNWDVMPVGTMCGIHMASQGGVRANDLCQGVNPRYGCPAKFSRRTLGYFEAGGGYRAWVTCVKTRA